MNVWEWLKPKLVPVCVGLVIGAGGFYVLGAGSLSRSLADARNSLADAQSVDRRVTASNVKLQSELADAHNQLAEQQQQLDQAARDSASEQQALTNLAGIVASAGGDLYRRTIAIAKGFDELYAIYQKGAGASAGP